MYGKLYKNDRRSCSSYKGLSWTPQRQETLYHRKKITRIRGSGLNFYGLRDDVMCILLVFGLQRAILKIFGGILWGHSLRSGEMQYKKPSFTQNHCLSYHTGAPHEGYIFWNMSDWGRYVLLFCLYITTFRLSISF